MAFIYRVSTKIGYSVNMLLLRNFLNINTVTFYMKLLHWSLLKFSNEDITHLKRIAINLKFQWNYSTCDYILYQN